MLTFPYWMGLASLGSRKAQIGKAPFFFLREMAAPLQAKKNQNDPATNGHATAHRKTQVPAPHPTLANTDDNLTALKG